MDGASSDQRQAGTSDWLQPPVEETGLRQYVRILRERIWIVVASVVLTTGIAVVYVVTANKVYEATADLLITPVSATDTSLSGLPLIHQSSDPTRDVETAAQLVTNVDVANRVKQELNSPKSANAILEKVTAEPVAQSNIVAVTAKGDSPAKAQELANAFAAQATAEPVSYTHLTLPTTERV